MRVLGVDPGYDRLGVAILERSDGSETVLHSACATSDPNHSMPERFHTLGATVASLLRDYQPELVAVETLFFNQNQKTAIAVAQIRGIILYLAQEAGCTIKEYGPQTIKVATTGYGKSDKQAVLAMVPRLVTGAPASATDDEFDAIAVAITALAHQR